MKLTSKTIISTTIGAEGINYSHNKNIIIADSPEEFCEAIYKCISNEEFCFTIGSNASKLADEEYNNTVIGSSVLDFYNSVITKS